MSRNWGTPLLCGASALVLNIAAAGTAEAGPLPDHGHFAEGRGNISRSGGRLTVDQTSRTAIVDWESFSVGKPNAIRFANGDGATLNIIEGGNLSRIAGSLTSGGSVYLVNRSGIVMTGSSRIDTQGMFAASSRNADSSSFGDGKRPLFSGHGKANIVYRGTISARNVSLIAGGRLRVKGSIAAKGRVETSGGSVGLSGAAILARDWLIDPKTLTVTSAAATSIGNGLGGGTSIILKTTSSSCSGSGSCASGKGDIIVNAPITWSTAAKLTLDAFHGVTMNASVHLKGKGSLFVVTNDGGMGGYLTFGSASNVTFDNLAAKLKINGNSYKLVNSLDQLASGIANNPSGYFALTSDYSAAKDGIYTSSPVPTTFEGTFDGLGHAIDGLTIKDVSDSNVGLFSDIDMSGTVRNIHLTNADVSGLKQSADVGILAGTSNGTINGAGSSGRVVGGSYANVGGLIGYNGNTILLSYSNADVFGGDGSKDGGFVGYDHAIIDQSYATGDVTGLGGVTLGGFVGYHDGSITNCYASGSVVGTGGDIGGFVGYTDTTEGLGGVVNTSYSAGFVLGASGTATGFGGETDSFFSGDYWDTTTSLTSTGVSGGSNSGVTGRTDGQLKSGIPGAFSSAIWASKANINGGLPYLKSNPPQ